MDHVYEMLNCLHLYWHRSLLILSKCQVVKQESQLLCRRPSMQCACTGIDFGFICNLIRRSSFSNRIKTVSFHQTRHVIFGTLLHSKPLDLIQTWMQLTLCLNQVKRLIYIFFVVARNKPWCWSCSLNSMGIIHCSVIVIWWLVVSRAHLLYAIFRTCLHHSVLSS